MVKIMSVTLVVVFASYHAAFSDRADIYYREFVVYSVCELNISKIIVILYISL